MTTKRKPRIESQAATRRHLLDAAEPLFEERGLQRTSVAQIAAAAGYTTGAIYSNFPRKEDLAVAVLERSGQASWDELVLALNSHDDFADRLLAVVEWRRRVLVEREPIGVLRLELWLTALRDPALRAALVADQHRLQTSFAVLLQQQAAHVGSELTVDPHLLAASLLAAADGTAIVNGLDPSSRQSEAFAWVLATLVVGSFEPKPIPAADWPAFVERMLAAAR